MYFLLLLARKDCCCGRTCCFFWSNHCGIFLDPPPLYSSSSFLSLSHYVVVFLRWRFIRWDSLVSTPSSFSGSAALLLLFAIALVGGVPFVS